MSVCVCAGGSVGGDHTLISVQKAAIVQAEESLQQDQSYVFRQQRKLFMDLFFPSVCQVAVARGDCISSSQGGSFFNLSFFFCLKKFIF